MAPSEVILLTITRECPPDAEKRFRERFPDIELHIALCTLQTKTTELFTPEIWRRCTILISLFAWPKEEEVPNVHWYHVFSAGVQHVLDLPQFKRKEISWTNGNGVHGPQIGEWVFMTALAHFRQLPLFLRYQKEQYWVPADDFHIPMRDLHGMKIGILGYGSIGRHIGRLADAIGMDIEVYTLHEKPTPESRRDTNWSPPKTGDPEGKYPSRWWHGKDQLHSFLSSNLDILVITAPSTPTTRGIIGPKEIALLKQCLVSNIGRGNLVQTDPLVEALNNEHLAGATLDVMDPEPLPKGHPLWTAKNTIITPHMAGFSDSYFERSFQIVGENLIRRREGKELVNVINREDGY